MNKFDEQYEIRLALYKDIENIMDFIHKYWKKDHILMKDRRLFEYEFLEGKQVNIIIVPILLILKNTTYGGVCGR